MPAIVFLFTLFDLQVAHGLPAFPKSVIHKPTKAWSCAPSFNKQDMQVCFNGGYPFDSDPILGVIPRPNRSTSHFAFKGEKVFFDVSYTHDQYSRRITPTNTAREFKGHAIFAGCSLTYGHALNDNETLAYHFGQQAVKLRPYNYGVTGSGPHVALAKLQKGFAPKEIQQDRGHYFYSFADFQVYRANGYFRRNDLHWQSPYYKLDDLGRPHRAGSFATGRVFITSLYKFFGNFLNLGHYLARSLPARGEYQNNLTCSIIKEAQKQYLKHFPQGQFWVLRHPHDNDDTPVISCLEKKSVNILRVQARNEYWKQAKNYRVPGDGHPNDSFQALLAQRLHQALQQHPNYQPIE